MCAIGRQWFIPYAVRVLVDPADPERLVGIRRACDEHRICLCFIRMATDKPLVQPPEALVLVTRRSKVIGQVVMDLTIRHGQEKAFVEFRIVEGRHHIARHGIPPLHLDLLIGGEERWAMAVAEEIITGSFIQASRRQTRKILPQDRHGRLRNRLVHLAGNVQETPVVVPDAFLEQEDALRIVRLDVLHILERLLNDRNRNRGL